ncbi:sulfite exporter TauE/SafE family protein [Tunturiibacter lichenicola]|uniref:sulfite exporter TauE/SafE family protein n=1 Tax=Tunturiibacter lichenicola TaxID=2051959 RepID=UPI003D9AF7F4
MSGDAERQRVWHLMDATTLHVLIVIFFATLFRSAFGFGESLIAVPLLALFIPLKVATPLSVLVSITIAAVVVMQDWRKIHVRSAGWLVVCSLFGIPVGLLLLTSTHQQAVKIVLAVLIIAFSIYSLFGRKPPDLKNDSGAWLFGCGFAAGVIGGAFGMNGPPLVIYGAMRRWSAQHFRATLQAYFLPASLIGVVGYWLAGLWVPAVTHYYLMCLPVLLPGVWLGRVVNHRLHGDSFLRYVYVGLAGIGVVLLAESLRG